MSLRYEAHSSAAPAAAWSLLARPRRWSEWAPHVRGASGLGDPEVRAGRIGVVWLRSLPPLPVWITAAHPERSWSWRVGLLEMHHEVLPRETGSTVRVGIDAAPAIEAAVARTYGLVIPSLLARLARRAEHP